MDLSRIARGGTPIDLDRTRIIFFDMQASFLLYQKFGRGYLSELFTMEPAPTKENPALKVPVLRDVETLAFYLWVGLLADARDANEKLTLDRVQEFIRPTTLNDIVNSVIIALGTGINNPAEPGKADAEAAGGPVPADPGPLKHSTTRKRSASVSRSSGKRPTSSSRRR